ncbi:MAG: hypothetical protein ACU0CS_10390, partial [Heliomarina sp.]
MRGIERQLRAGSDGQSPTRTSVPAALPQVRFEPRLTDAAGRANVGFRPARRTMMELVSFHQVTPGIADDHPRRMQE